MSSANIFPIFHPVNEQFLYFKSRDLVHREGDWHRGIQANVIRESKTGSFEILVQERSDHVDIGANKYDQSLATQMIKKDNLNEKTALERGLASELNIHSFRCMKLPIKIRIVKTYDEQPEILNQELLSLYLVVASPNENVVNESKKVKRIFWMQWDEFLQFFRNNTNKFTKTAKLYFSNTAILDMIYIWSRCILLKEKYRISKDIIIHIDKYHTAPITYIHRHANIRSI